jgi:hypothetical protein
VGHRTANCRSSWLLASCLQQGEGTSSRLDFSSVKHSDAQCIADHHLVSLASKMDASLISYSRDGDHATTNARAHHSPVSLSLVLTPAGRRLGRGLEVEPPTITAKCTRRATGADCRAQSRKITQDSWTPIHHVLQQYVCSRPHCSIFCLVHVLGEGEGDGLRRHLDTMICRAATSCRTSKSRIDV